jgi:hypothetical protein
VISTASTRIHLLAIIWFGQALWKDGLDYHQFLQRDAQKRVSPCFQLVSEDR